MELVMNSISPFEIDPVNLIPDVWTDLSRLPIAFETLEGLVDAGLIERRLVPHYGAHGRVLFQRRQYRAKS